MDHRTIESVRACFPKAHAKPRPNQEAAFELIAKYPSLVLEAGTGTGKTAIGMTFLGHQKKQSSEHRFFLVPNKTIAEQVHTLYPDTRIMLGRNEHPCLYYPGQGRSAADVGCAMLGDCPHRVMRDTGETYVAGVKPCPYLQQKYDARTGDAPVVATFAFFLFSHFFSREWEGETATVIDEADSLADCMRSVLSYEINEKTVSRAAAILAPIAPEEARHLRHFASTLRKIVSAKPSGRQFLLSQDEVQSLFKALMSINGRKLAKEVSKAVRESKIDTHAEAELLKQLSDIAASIPRYLTSVGYALDGGDERNHKALSYICAFWKQDEEEQSYKLIVKSVMVSGLISRMLPQKRLLAMSATIGDPEIFRLETGIKAQVHVLDHVLPARNARIYMPTDTPNLAVNNRGKRAKHTRSDKARAFAQIADSVSMLKKQGRRALVVVVSDGERRSCVAALQKAGLEVVTYGPQDDGSVLRPKDAALLFRKGRGDVLVGTNAQFSKGIDLPNGSASVVLVLRPAYPSPDDPLTQFQEKRLGHRRWALWNHKVTVDALQVRGRNIRSARDKGVTIFISQQFRRFVFHALPQSLRESYKGEQTLAQCIKETIKFLE